MVSKVLKQLEDVVFPNRRACKTYGYHLASENPDINSPRWFIGYQTTNIANMEVNEEDLTVLSSFNDDQQIILICKSKFFSTRAGKNTVICSPSEQELIQALKDLAHV
jgi:hypothetical protein